MYNRSAIGNHMIQSYRVPYKKDHEESRMELFAAALEMLDKQQPDLELTGDNAKDIQSLVFDGEKMTIIIEVPETP
jgi:hypothetical protein